LLHRIATSFKNQFCYWTKTDLVLDHNLIRIASSFKKRILFLQSRLFSSSTTTSSFHHCLFCRNDVDLNIRNSIERPPIVMNNNRWMTTVKRLKNYSFNFSNHKLLMQTQTSSSSYLYPCSFNWICVSIEYVFDFSNSTFSFLNLSFLISDDLEIVQISFFKTKQFTKFEEPVQFGSIWFIIVQFGFNELPNRSDRFGGSFGSELNFAHL
jgi:hypothetical protein